ncbi:MAG TPA: adenosine deaminase [Lachnospiraceae bacterium]|nr:adenosine deaminase [Lachnospiraceae bacterium]
MKQKIRQWPKIELHCHLDGSIRRETFRRMAEQEGIDCPQSEEELTAYLKAPADCTSLKEYLEPFGRVGFCMQKTEYLETVTCDCLHQAKEDGIIYQEIRFAPAFSLGKGLSMEDAVRSVIRGIRRGTDETGVESRVILCMMRGRPEIENQEVIDTFLSIRRAGGADAMYLGGLDLAGDEASYPLIWYERLFRKARTEKIPFTIHAGECGSWENIRCAVRLGARRIGHGIAAAENPEIMRLLNEFQIGVEMCPTSNYQTRAVQPGREYPLGIFLKKKLRVSLHTDNRTVSDTTLSREYEWAMEHFPWLQEEDFCRMNLNALQEAFLPEEKKKELRQKLLRGYESKIN